MSTSTKTLGLLLAALVACGGDAGTPPSETPDAMMTPDQPDAAPGTPDAGGGPPDGAVALPELKLDSPVGLSIAQTEASLDVQTTSFTLAGKATGDGVEVRINAKVVPLDPVTHAFSLPVTLETKPCGEVSAVQAFVIVARNSAGGEVQKTVSFTYDVCPPVATYGATIMYDELAVQGFLTTFAGDMSPCLWRRNTGPAQVTFNGTGTPTIGKYHTNLDSAGGNAVYGGGGACARAPAVADATPADANPIKVAWNLSDNVAQRSVEIRTYVRVPGGVSRPILPAPVTVDLTMSNPLIPVRHEQALVEEQIPELATLPGAYTVWAEVKDSFGHVTTTPEFTFNLTLRGGPLAPPDPDNTHLGEYPSFTGSLAGGGLLNPSLSGNPYGIHGYRLENRTQKSIYVDLSGNVTLRADEARRRMIIDDEVSELESCPATGSPGAWSGVAPARHREQDHNWTISIKDICSSCSSLTLAPGQVAYLHPRVYPASFIAGFDDVIAGPKQVFRDNLGGTGFYPGTCYHPCLRYGGPNGDSCLELATTYNANRWQKSEILTSLQLSVVENSTLRVWVSAVGPSGLSPSSASSLATPTQWSYSLTEDASIP